MDSNATEPGPALTKPGPQEEERAEQLLRQYMVHLRRGETVTSQKLLDEAISIAPGSKGVLLAQANDLVERKQTKAAASLLKSALELYPEEPKLEDLYGELVLRNSGLAGMTAPSELGAMAQGGKVPTILAALFPGSGHMVLGEWVTGAVYMGVIVSCIVWATIIPNGMSGLMALVGLNRSTGTDLNAMVFVPVLIGFLAWVLNIADVTSRSKKVEVVATSRPAPPVDKPFEL